MFKVVKRDSVWWPVMIEVPRGDGTKKMDTYKIKVQYKLLGRKEMESMDPDSDIAEYIMDWDGIVDENNDPIPFSRERLDELLDNIHVLKGFAKGFQEAQLGADSKN